MKNNENSEFIYLYRDASNYKFYSTITIKGILQESSVREYLHEGDYFLPEKIGLKSLVPEIRTEDDHEWHELVSIKKSSDKNTLIESELILSRFRLNHEKGWDEK